MEGEERELSGEAGPHEVFEKWLKDNEVLASERWIKELDVSGDVQNAASYTELKRLADAIARALFEQLTALKESAAQQQQPMIAMCMPPSIERVATTLALWKLGAAFIPLDPKLPPERAVRMIRVARPVAAVALGAGDGPQAELLQRANEMLEKENEAIRVLKLNVLLQPAGVCMKPNGRIDISSVPEAIFSQAPIWKGEEPLALVIFTSGSTGVPKGVRIAQSGLLARLYWQWEASSPIAYRPDEISLLKTNILFFDSITETFSAVGRLVNAYIVPPQLQADPSRYVALVQKCAVTRVVMVPSTWLHQMQYAAERQETLPSIHTLILSGEQLKSSLVRLSRRVCTNPQLRVANLYGSTETTGEVLSESVKLDELGDETADVNVPIGRALSNTRVYLLDALRQPLGEGQEGDLYVAGALVAKGYVPDKWANSNAGDAFTANEFIKEDERERYGVLYRMGDRAILRGGRVALIGRNEDMVKIIGVRVYLSEISRALQESYSAISRVHALSLPAPPALVRGPLIVVFYSIAPTAGAASSAAYSDRELIAAVQRSVNLPTVAFLFEQLLETEFTYQPHSGKLDREAMKRRAQQVVERRAEELAMQNRLRTTESTYFGGAMDEIARGVLEALYSVLETALVLTPEDELKALGLSSITAVQLADVLATRGFPIPLEELFDSKTVRNLIDAVSNLKAVKKAGGSEPTAEPLSKYEVSNFVKANEEMLTQARTILCESFTYHNEMNLVLDMPLEQFAALFDMLPFEPFEHSKCSFTVCSKEKPDVVLGLELAADHNEAVAVSKERAAAFQEAVAKMPPVGQIMLVFAQFMDDLFERYLDAHRLQADGAMPHRWLYSYMGAVASSVVRRADGESAVLIDLIERETLRRARQNGYTAIYTANTNRATIASGHRLGYETIHVIHPQEFEMEGTKPFVALPSDFVVELVVKYL